MSIWAWPGKKAEPDFGQYFLIIGLEIVAIILLRLVQIYRLKMREKRKTEKENKL